MAKGKLLQQMKMVIHCLVDGNGNFRTIPIGEVGYRNLDNERINLLQSLIDLLLDTDIIKPETKMYLKDENISMANVARDLSYLPENKGKDINTRTIINKIMFEQSKLERIFGENIIVDIVYSIVDVSHYTEIIAAQMNIYGDTKWRDSLLIEIPADEASTKITDDEFIQLMEALAPYFKSQAEKTINELPKSSLGYLNYIFSSSRLNEIDEKRKKELIHIKDNGLKDCDID